MYFDKWEIQFAVLNYLARLFPFQRNLQKYMLICGLVCLLFYNPQILCFRPKRLMKVVLYQLVAVYTNNFNLVLSEIRWMSLFWKSSYTSGSIKIYSLARVRSHDRIWLPIIVIFCQIEFHWFKSSIWYSEYCVVRPI